MACRFVTLVTTVPSRRHAARIARALVEERLAACVQVSGPVRSTYWWKGKVETATEWVCAAKTRASLSGKAEQAVRKLHPYETPEIVVLSITGGSAEYLDWVAAETKARPGRAARPVSTDS